MSGDVRRGVFVWAGIYFRDPQLRALLPLRK